MIRKNITLTQNQYETIERHAKNKGVSFSEFLRSAALNEIKREADLDLLQYLRKNTSAVTKEEQAEFESLDIHNFDRNDFVELNLDDILQD